MEAVIDDILFFVVADCKRSPESFCESRKAGSSTSTSCIHARTVLSCLTVCRGFLVIGARYLWTKYARFFDLLALVETYSKESGQCCQSITQHEVERWQFYSRFLTTMLSLEGRQSRNLLLVAEMAVELEGKQLLPNLKSLELRFVEGFQIRGGQLFAAHLLSPCTSRFSVGFPHTPSAETVRSFVRAACQYAGAITDLTVHCGYDDNLEDIHPTNRPQDMLNSSLPMFPRLVALEKLSLAPGCITIPVLDAIGILPRLREFTACHDEINASVTLPVDSN